MKKFLLYSLSCAAILALSSCSESKRESAAAADATTTPSTSATSVDTASSSTSNTGMPDIPEGIAGVWVEDAAKANTEGADAEAAITICEGGRASYAVFSNQLFIFMKAALREKSEGDNLLFYFDGEDAGSGFREARLKSPAPGALIATGHIEGDVSILVMDWSPAAEYISSIRAAVKGPGGRTIFPRKFFVNAAAMAGLCEETE